MFSYQFLFPLNSKVNDRNELFPTDAPESEHSMIYLKIRPLYDLQ